MQGLRWKSTDVLNLLYSNLPHILCFTEHYLNQHEIEIIRIDNYTLGASFGKTTLKWVACVFLLTRT
jgi:hypothetical protein